MKRFIYVIVTGCLLAASLYFMPIMQRASGEEKEIQTICSKVLAEAGTGTIINGEREDILLQQGSLPKLMTALLTAEEIEEGRLSLSDTLTAGDEVTNIKGAVVWLTPGEEITVDELLKSVVVGNANDAAAVLAERIGGTQQGFVDMMNARAFELGMRRTIYKSCSGNEDAGEYTTARDTVRLACELLKHELLKPYFTTWTDTVRNGQTEVVNENRLVRTYEGITGLKAGRMGENYYLVFAAERNGVSFVSAVLDCPDKDERFSIGKALMTLGFSSYKVTTPQFSDEFLRPVEVHGGMEKAVMISAARLRELVIPKGCGELQTAVLIPKYIDAPVKKGQKIGTVGFYNGDTLLYETDLIAADSVQRVNFKYGVGKCLEILYKK